MLVVLLLLCAAFVCNSQQSHQSVGSISVSTSLGTLVGTKQLVQNKTINVFYGVPYAVPPVNELRFKRTKLISKFPKEPYYALDYTPHCQQVRSKKYDANDKFSEDCLYMNIWTPHIESNRIDGKCKTKYNVMLYIYGGKSVCYIHVISIL